MIDTVFRHAALADRPPVLVDIGASGALPALWAPIARHSVCVAFDADDREFKVEESDSTAWKKLYRFNRLVSAESRDAVDFYLTQSPYCSSSLEPDLQALEVWAYQDLFKVQRVIRLPAASLLGMLQQVGITRIDWYKTDSQGTDLRIFKTLPPAMMASVLAADFEPGILDAYKGEDKLPALMAFMDGQPFWVCDMAIKGTQRIDQRFVRDLDVYGLRALNKYQKIAPGWCEISYLNTFSSDALGLREHLLGWVFASLLSQHGFAMRLASQGEQRFGDALFAQLLAHSREQLQFSPWELAYVKTRRFVGRLLGRR